MYPFHSVFFGSSVVCSAATAALIRLLDLERDLGVASPDADGVDGAARITLDAPEREAQVHPLTIDSPIFIVNALPDLLLRASWLFVCAGALTSAVVLLEQAAIAATSKAVPAVLK